MATWYNYKGICHTLLFVLGNRASPQSHNTKREHGAGEVSLKVKLITLYAHRFLYRVLLVCKLKWDAKIISINHKIWEQTLLSSLKRRCINRGRGLQIAAFSEIKKLFCVLSFECQIDQLCEHSPQTLSARNYIEWMLLCLIAEMRFETNLSSNS